MLNVKHAQDDLFFFSAEHDFKAESLGFPQHYHDLLEIYFLEEGNCHFFIDNKSYQLEAGDIVLCPGGTIHKAKYEDTDYKRVLINCSRYYIPGSIFKDISNIIYVYRNDNITTEVKHIFDSLKKEYESGDKYSAEAIRGLMYMLFIMLARNENKKSQTLISNAYIDTAIEYIKNNFQSQITLTDIAKKCSVSTEHMSRIFKKETGCCFSEYLTYTRLQHAEYLLKNSNLSITETAQSCGFSDSNYFSVVFKKNYKKSPMALKKEFKSSKK